MVNNLVSVKQVIANALIDIPNLATVDIKFGELVEWISRAMQQIGSYYQFTARQSEIHITNYKGELPCDFYKLIQLTDSTSNGITLNPNLTHNAYLQGDNKKEIDRNSHSLLDYQIVNNIITTNVQDKKLYIQYLAFPIDEEGFMLIPDNVAYLEALIAYIVYKLCYQGVEFKQVKLRDLEYTKMEWERRCAAARGEANMPDPDMMERLKNMYLKLVPDQNAYVKKWRDLGVQEALRLNGKTYTRNFGSLI